MISFAIGRLSRQQIGGARNVVGNVFDVVRDDVSIVKARYENFLLPQEPGKNMVNSMWRKSVGTPSNIIRNLTRSRVQLDVWVFGDPLFWNTPGNVYEYLSLICDKV